MTSLLKTAALAAMLGTGASAIPAAAHADSLYFGIGQSGPEFGVVTDRTSPRHDDRRWDDDRRGHDRWERREGRRCTPERALDKAERMGVRRAFIRDVDRRTIEVGGRQRGERVAITFARAPGCPVLDW